MGCFKFRREEFILKWQQLWSSEARRRTVLLTVVMAIALVLRLVWLSRVHPVPQSDFAWYRSEAMLIRDGAGYVFQGHPTAYFPIGYPLFLAGIFGVFGVHWWAAVVANVLLSTATAGLIYLVSELIFGWRSGLCGGLLMACYLPHIEWSSVLCSEILFTFLFLLSTYLWIVRPPTERQWKWLVLSGVTLGLACIVRPVVLLLPGAFLLYSLFSRIGVWESVKRTAVISAVMAATISPMTIRNYIDFHHFIPVSTNGGVNLWQGNNPHANGQYYWPSNTAENPFLAYAENEVVDNQRASHMAMQYIEHHPVRTVQVGFTKWHNLFKGVDNVQFWSIGHAKPPVAKSTMKTVADVALFNYRLISLLAVVGLLIQGVYVWRTKDGRPVLMWLVIAYYVGLFFFFPAWDRMRAPIEPWLIWLAGTSIAASWQPRRFFGRRSPQNRQSTDFK